jgi:RNA polymerase sigma factor (sigma-70 family)
MTEREQWFLHKVKLAREGNKWAEEALYDFITRQLKWVGQACLRRGVPPQDVEAASHDAAARFILHLRKIEHWDKYAVVMAYLAKCVRTAARKNRAGSEEQLIDIDPPGSYDLDPWVISVDVSDAMSMLPRPIADAIYLVYCEQYKYAEAAELLGCTLDSLKAKLKKGRKQLRALLEKQRHDYLKGRMSFSFTNEKRLRMLRGVRDAT